MKRFLKVLFISMLVLSSLFSLSYAAKNPKDFFVVHVTKELSNPFFVECKWGGQAAANKNGVRYECLAPEKYSVENQIRLMEDLIQRKVDAIVLNPIDGKGIIPGIKQANKAGIPVMVVDTKAEGGDLLGYVTISNVLMGKAMAQSVVNKFKGKAKVIILEGTTGASSAQDRQTGIMEIFDANSGIKVLQSTTARYDRQIAMRVMEDLLVRFPEIDAVVAHNDMMALGAIEAIKEARRLKEIAVIGSDAIPEALSSVNRNELYGSADGKAFDILFTAVDLTCKYLLKDEVPPKETIFLQGLPTVITKQNIKQWNNHRVKEYEKYGLKMPDELKLK